MVKTCCNDFPHLLFSKGYTNMRMTSFSDLPEEAVLVVFVVVEVVSEVVDAVAVVEVVVEDSASEAELLLLFLFTTKLVPRP